MSPPAERGDYVLGTGDAELERLELQHAVWRPHGAEAWCRAGITAGTRVLDVGAGPGYATADLAELVAPTGTVVALERSARFLDHARALCAARGHAGVQFHELDLATDPIPVRGFDAAWVRWVASFLASPALLVEKLARALRPGARLVFHEYADYAAWRFEPRSEPLEEFVRTVMESWRRDGGEPDVAPLLPPLLERSGFELRSVRSHVFRLAPGDPMWRWPTSFVATHLDRLVALGRADRGWSERVRAKLERFERDPEARMHTPEVRELIAVRRFG